MEESEQYGGERTLLYKETVLLLLLRLPHFNLSVFLNPQMNVLYLILNENLMVCHCSIVYHCSYAEIENIII